MYDKDTTYSINCKFMVTEATVNIVNKSNNPLPEYATQGSSGMDIKAYIEDGSVIVLKTWRKKINTHRIIYSTSIRFIATTES